MPWNPIERAKQRPAQRRSGFHADLPDGTVIDHSEQDEVIRMLLLHTSKDEARASLFRHDWNLQDAVREVFEGGGWDFPLDSQAAKRIVVVDANKPLLVVETIGRRTVAASDATGGEGSASASATFDADKCDSFFTVCLNPAVTAGHTPSDLEALQREFADWFPGPVLLTPETEIRCRDKWGKVVKHRQEDPKTVWVCLKGELENVKTFYKSIHHRGGISAEDDTSMQHAVNSLLSPTASGARVTVIGYNECCAWCMCSTREKLQYSRTLLRPLHPMQAIELRAH